MKFKTFAATAAMTAIAVGISSGVVDAEPAPAPGAPPAVAPGTSIQTDLMPGIHYTSSIVDNSVVITTDRGSMMVQGNQFQVLDDHGNLVAGLPLTYRKDATEWPIAAQVEGNRAVLTPNVDPAAARPAAQINQAEPIASQAQ